MWSLNHGHQEVLWVSGVAVPTLCGRVQLSAGVALICVIVAAKLLLTVSIHVCGVGVPPGLNCSGPLLGHRVINQNLRGSQAAAERHFCVHSRVLTTASWVCGAFLPSQAR